MDLRKLEQFVVAAKRGSFGQASKELHLSQPSLTRNIHRLEEELGAALFDRSPRGVALTAQGEKLLPIAQALLNQADRVMTELHPQRRADKGQVRIGASPNFLSFLLPDAIRAFLDDMPGINVQVSTGTAEVLSGQLRLFELDFAFEQLPLVRASSLDETGDLVFEPLMDLVYGVYAPAGHPATGLTQPSLAALGAFPWAIPYQLSLSYIFENAYFRNGLPIPVQSLNSASISLIKFGLLQCGLLTVLPAYALASELAQGKVVSLDVPELRLAYKGGLLFVRDRKLTKACEALMNRIRSLTAASATATQPSRMSSSLIRSI